MINSSSRFALMRAGMPALHKQPYGLKRSTNSRFKARDLLGEVFLGVDVALVRRIKLQDSLPALAGRLITRQRGAEVRDVGLGKAFVLFLINRERISLTLIRVG